MTINWDKSISIDIETTGLNIYSGDIRLVAFCLPKFKPGVKTEIPNALRKILEDESIVKIIHNAAFDIPFIRLQTGIHIRNIFDTMLAEKLLAAGRFNYSASLKETLSRHGIVKLNKDVEHNVAITKEYREYAKNDVRYLLTLAIKQYNDLKKLNMLEVLELENKCVEVTSEMRYHGIGFDKQVWLAIAEANENKYNGLLKKLGGDVNWNSPKQVKEQFAHLGLKSFDDLPNLKGKNKRLDIFIEARELYKSVTSYGKGWLWRDKKETEPTLDDDGRVRCSFNQIIDTGRYSSSQPNMQQLPARGDHRKAFVPKKGYKLCVADFSGQELGIMAAASKEQQWIKIMEEGKDLHEFMGRKIFGDSYSKELRPLAKDLNFGLAYGKGVESFAVQAKLDINKARNIVYKYKRSVPTLIRWLDKNGNEGVKDSVSRSLPPFNRLRILDGEDWQKRNKGKNHPVQGTGADMIKLALVRLYEYIYEHKLDVKIVLCVHDEILTEVKASYAKQWCEIKKRIMEQAAYDILKYKLVRTTPKIVNNWAEAKG